MKILSKIMNILMAAVVIFALLAAIGSAIKKEPFLLTVIRSNSMYPVWERGDMVLVKNLSDEKKIEIGDIAIFKTEEGSLSTKGWIAHRIISGNAKDGYITQGDANSYTDQNDGTGPIQSKWIAGTALTVLGKPVVIPFIGHLSLYVEKFQSSPLLLPIIALILGAIIVFEEIRGGKNTKRKKKKSFDLPIIYFLGGLTISVVIGASMLASGQHLSLIYEVSKSSNGVMMGSDVGVLKVGDQVERPLADLANEGAFPLIGTITTNDPQITSNLEKSLVKPGDDIKTMYTVEAKKAGKYESSIHVGLFYPLLPSSVIYTLANQSYWLALIVVSLLPGLPLMLFPILNGQLRRKTVRELKRSFRKIKRFAY
jgi:signal peptidase I